LQRNTLCQNGGTSSLLRKVLSKFKINELRFVLLAVDGVGKLWKESATNIFLTDNGDSTLFKFHIFCNFCNFADY